MRPIDPQKQQLEDQIKKDIQAGVPIAPELMDYAKSIFPTLQDVAPVPENYNELAQQEANDQNPFPNNYDENIQAEASEQDNFSKPMSLEKTPEEMQAFRDKMRAAYPGDTSFGEPEQVQNNELTPEMKDYAYKIFPDLQKIVPQRQQMVEGIEVPEQTQQEQSAASRTPTQIKEEQKITVPETQKIQPVIPSSEDDIDKLMKEVDKREKSAEMDLAIAKFRDAIIGAGGTGFKSDLSQYERAIKNAKKPLTDYETRMKLMEARDQINDKKAKNDPQSGISKMLRQSLSDIGVSMEGFDNVSYSQLEKIYPSLANAAATKIAADAKKIEAIARREEVAQSKLDKMDLENQKNAISHIDFSMRQLAKPYQEYEQGISQIDSANKIIEEVKNKKITPGVADVTALYTLVKGLDPSSAVREGEISLSREAMSLWGRIYSGVKGELSGGDLLDNATRKSIQEILKAIQVTREKSFARQKSALVQAGVGKGIDKSILESSIYPEVRSVQTNPEEIRTKMINGVPVKYRKTSKGWEKVK